MLESSVFCNALNFIHLRLFLVQNNSLGFAHVSWSIYVLILFTLPLFRRARAFLRILTQIAAFSLIFKLSKMLSTDLKIVLVFIAFGLLIFSSWRILSLKPLGHEPLLRRSHMKWSRTGRRSILPSFFTIPLCSLYHYQRILGWKRLKRKITIRRRWRWR